MYNYTDSSPLLSINAATATAKNLAITPRSNEQHRDTHKPIAACIHVPPERTRRFGFCGRSLQGGGLGGGYSFEFGAGLAVVSGGGSAE